MKIWFVNLYGNIPGESWTDHRYTLIANAFNKDGHEVVWWVSGFEHRSKKFRSLSWKDIKINEKFLIRIVPTTSYKNHISVARVKSERTYAKNFRARALQSSDKPDLMIVGEPAMFISSIIMDVIRKKNTPFIVDIQDLQPELFNILLPNKLSFLGKFIFAPLYRRRALFFGKAQGLMALSKDYLELGLKYNPTKFRAVIYWGINLDEFKLNKYHQFNSEACKNLNKSAAEKWVIYVGTLGDNYDIKTILLCAAKIQKQRLPIKILIAGDGSLRTLIENTIRNENLASLVYLGRLDAEDLKLLYKYCDIALSSYVQNSTVSMPTKAYDYFAAGLPIVNSLKRDVGEFIVEYKVGLQYTAEDPDDMLRAITTLSNDTALRSEMKRNALMLAEEFHCPTQYKKVVVLAEKILGFKKKQIPKF